MKMVKIDACHQNFSRWSGGTTTQLAIFPPQAVYAQRNFLWRISSAVVELPESDFTPLPDYDRILMILDGELTLSHDGGEEYTLRALEQTSFDGASRTVSRGQVTDFNLMMRKDRCTGRVEAKKLGENAVWSVPLSGGFDKHLLYCVEGEAQIAAFKLFKGDALLIEGNAQCVLSGSGTVVLAQIKEL